MFLMLPILSLALFFFLPAYAAGPLWLGVSVAALYTRWSIHRSVQFPPLTGIESMAGRAAVVVDPLHLVGTIRYQGEIWRAASEVPIEAGARVRIVRVQRLPEGLIALVQSLDASAEDLDPGRCGVS